MKVSVVRCASYDEVHEAIRLSLDNIGGLQNHIKKGEKVLLKINQISGYSPEKAATTHPLFVKAVADMVKSAGGIPFIGDSPGFGSLHDISKLTGISQIGYPLINLDEPIEIVRFDREFIISKRIGEFDKIINLPKLKAHFLTGLTGAVKNMFGCVPGVQKSKYHQLLGEDELSLHFVQLEKIISPSLVIMDAVIGMEGYGPSNGTPRKIGAIIAGTDSMSVDIVAAKIIGYSEKEVSTIRIGKKMDNKANIHEIELIGETIFIPDFRRADKYDFRLRSCKPEVDKQLCSLCKDCEKMCPTEAIKVKDFAVIDYSRCISCFCCYEICRYHAIKLKKQDSPGR